MRPSRGTHERSEWVGEEVPEGESRRTKRRDLARLLARARLLPLAIAKPVTTRRSFSEGGWRGF
ncbi:MAG: hypothetical protein COV46_03025 [Deltaproteobacteria bacterium CG11_big_fil_rev_8_21_14_0_20_49_13]|nr:MAG: hypothetical protein COV46_03025 [Deltaproteobacteria bacterium CG11_big_fil_rev_8_21_14_0_20_49_13]